MNLSDKKFTGEAAINSEATMLSFWHWAFSDLCDDDIKGIFAEWMVGVLLGLPLASSRRVSWADSDFVLPDRTRIEVKATALWQSWKLVNEDGTLKSTPDPAMVDPSRIRFGGLRARMGTTQAVMLADARHFKSDHYVFCFQNQISPVGWNPWDLGNWEFYMFSREELAGLKIGNSVSLAALRKRQPAMTAKEFQSFARYRLQTSLAASAGKGSCWPHDINPHWRMNCTHARSE
jgi:hypothetical protein